MTKAQKYAFELMPKSEQELRILRARAEELAKPELDLSENNGIDYVRFRLGHDESYGISYQYVCEILHQVPVSRPPCIPHFISGVINWRGILITVVDLIKFFHSTSAKYDNEYIIVMHVSDITLGILVKQIEGSKTYQPSQLSSPLSSVKVTNPEYILGLHQSITAILNAEVLVSNLSKEIKKSVYRIGDVHGNC